MRPPDMRPCTAQHNTPRACVPSKLRLNRPGSVPTIPAAVTTVPFVPLPYDADKHAAAVADVHDALLQPTDSSSDAVALGSIELKFKPEIVTVAPPVCATL